MTHKNLYTYTKVHKVLLVVTLIMQVKVSVRDRLGNQVVSVVGCMDKDKVQMVVVSFSVWAGKDMGRGMDRVSSILT